MAMTAATAVDGGRANAAAIRRNQWNSTGGATGITTPGDLKVTALSVPGTAVNIAPGGGTIASTYPTAGKCESYGVNNDATFQVQIPGGMPADMNWAVIIRIDDYHYNGGTKPTDPKTALYNKPDVVFAANLGALIDPYLLLATVWVPKNKATITNDMITDRREVTAPRTKLVPRTNALLDSETEQLTNTTDAGERFPNAGGLQRIDVPYWATRMVVTAHLDGMLVTAAKCTGRLWIAWGDDDGSGVYFVEKTQEASYASEANANASRIDKRVSDYVAIPAKYRGRSNVAFATMGRVVTGQGPTMDGLSEVSLDVWFEEVADPSYT